MKVKLVIGQGPHKGKEIAVPSAGKYVIGRSSECHLRPASQAISKRHCSLEVRDGKLYAEDLNSTNGTFVNEQPLKGEREVANGDTLKVGPLDFVVKLAVSDAPPAAVAASSTPTPSPVQAQAEVPTQADKPPAEKPARKPAPVQKPAPAAVKATPPSKPGSAKKPAAAKANDHVDEDDVGAMLLDLDEGAKPEPGLTEEPVPEGSTIMDMLIPQKESGGASAPYRPKDVKQNQSAANTSNAAKDILDKYRRRPRT